MLQMPKTEATSAKIEEAQKNFSVYKISYEKLRDDVNIKLQFLDENRVRDCGGSIFTLSEVYDIGKP